MTAKKDSVVLCSDRGGKDMKKIIREFISDELKMETWDVGYNGDKDVSYFDYVEKLVEHISSGKYQQGILISNDTVGMITQANKYLGIRAAFCPDYLSAIISKRQFNTNVLGISLTCGVSVTYEEKAIRIVESWLSTDERMSEIQKKSILRINGIGANVLVRHKVKKKKFNPGREILIGADHAGFELKQELIDFLTSEGYGVGDIGTHSSESCDYSDFAINMVELMAAGYYERGILICGTGQGMAIAANHAAGVLGADVIAAVCNGMFDAMRARQHNNANIITLGNYDIKYVKQYITTWLNTRFEGGRHQQRIDNFLNYKKR